MYKRQDHIIRGLPFLEYEPDRFKYAPAITNMTKDDGSEIVSFDLVAINPQAEVA